MICLKWAGDGRKKKINKCKKHNLNREELSQLFFYISARRWQEREKKGQKKVFCNQLTEHLLRFCLSFPSTIFLRICWVIPITSVKRLTSREVGTVSGRTEHRLWVGKEGTGEQGSCRYWSAKEGLWERFGLYGQSLNKLLTLLTSKTPVYFINHPVHRWELSEHLVPSWRSPVYRNFNL